MRIPELLAPAGGMAQLKGAVENGADAVYLGGPLFNARISAENFSLEAMGEAIEYAHLRGVKIYVTMNTLMRDDEMKEALAACEAYCRMGADALIVQDMGLAGELRHFLPDMPLHLSTQGTVYDLAGVLAAKRLGFSRVVPAREVGLSELTEICNHPGTPEIEVFVHGALCMCYSGQCHLSREIGGRSGNRGACAQPCRLPYRVMETGAEQIRKKQNGKGVTPDRGISLGQRVSLDRKFPLSPKDLCLLDHLGDLASAGVASLKIEGRLKSAAYVAVVTGIYRKYLDQYKEKGFYRVEEEDRHALRQIFSRGPFTSGYFLGDPGGALMSGELSKHRGLQIGTVAGVSGGKGDPKRKLIDIVMEGKLSLGDGIEIVGKPSRMSFEGKSFGTDGKLPGNVITYIKEKKGQEESKKKNSVLTVGYLEGDIREGDRVFKITDKRLLEEAERSFAGGSWEAEKNLRKVRLDALIEINTENNVRLVLWDGDGNQTEKILGSPGEKALSRPLTREQIVGQLEKTGGTPFCIGEATVILEEGATLPLSSINGLRREALEEMIKLRTGIPFRRVLPEVLTGISEPPKASSPKLALYFHRTPEGRYRFSEAASWIESLSSGNPLGAPARLYLPYIDFLEDEYKEKLMKLRVTGIELIPALPAITKGAHNERIQANFDQILAAAQDGIAIGNLNWIKPFVDAGAKVYGDYGLNLQNGAALREAEEWGLTGAVVAHEAIGTRAVGANNGFCALNFHGLESEVAVGGRIPAMITAHCFPEFFAGKNKKHPAFSLEDRKGERFPLWIDEENRQSILFSHKEISADAGSMADFWRGFTMLRIYR